MWCTVRSGIEQRVDTRLVTPVAVTRWRHDGTHGQGFGGVRRRRDTDRCAPMNQMFTDLVSEAHPHHTMEPLDATVPTELALGSPTVIIEVVGAREGIDVLSHVRRVQPDAQIAAVRISAVEVVPEHPERRAGARALASIAGALTFAVAIVLAVWNPASLDSLVRVSIVVVAPTLVVVGVRAWQRTRRTPVERRRYFERRRSIAVIAVASADEVSASALASSIRRDLDSARPGAGRYDLRIVEPRPRDGEDQW